MIEHQIGNSYGNYNYNAYVYSGISWGTHFHKNYELIYIKKGSITVFLNGEANELKSGELLLISPYTIHSFEIDDKSVVWVGVFSEDFILSFSQKNNYIRYSKFRCNKKFETFLNENLFYQGQPDLYIIKSCLYVVCSECLKNAQAFNMKSTYDLRNRIIEFISENLTSDITLVETAAALGYEYHYFSALFHRCFSVNFRELINIFRFEHACEMLINTNRDITAVSEECGFQSIRNFNRIFKMLSGYTPSEYRKLH